MALGSDFEIVSRENQAIATAARGVSGELRKIEPQELAQVGHSRAAPGDGVDDAAWRYELADEEPGREGQVVALAGRGSLDTALGREVLLVRDDRGPIAAQRRLGRRGPTQERENESCRAGRGSAKSKTRTAKGRRGFPGIDGDRCAFFEHVRDPARSAPRCSQGRERIGLGELRRLAPTIRPVMLIMTGAGWHKMGWRRSPPRCPPAPHAQAPPTEPKAASDGHASWST